MGVQWNFEGKRAIVTGGSRGIGREMVKLLSQAGAEVMFTYRSSREAAISLERECAPHGPLVRAVPCNHAEEDEICRFRDVIAEEWDDRLDYVVNNVGITADNPMFRMTSAQWNSVLNTNLTSIFTMTQGLIRALSTAQGSVVNMTSVAGLTGAAGQVNYSAAKAGIIGLTKAMAKETAGLGVRVNAVAPGYVATDMFGHMPEAKQKRAQQAVPMRRLGQPAEAAAAAAFLLSDAASYITGHVLVVDGGLTLS
ncbi:3-oxoacyl-ACP reductase FabG [Paenibacillus tarimensis]|uniref:3-oxoacyl-ACP reductase FabG n=1 Tax=Paenibacillus tarimensis TaxID=416012 RepID=UPI001F28CDE4|nr:3-oxoacyl-ACP reductase FabG [Paenibacillus tarimensis]MCF2945605.1 3-oxoacyl-ACP reductase FabG [Paenibacillus tarimensis]